MVPIFGRVVSLALMLQPIAAFVSPASTCAVISSPHTARRCQLPIRAKQDGAADKERAAINTDSFYAGFGAAAGLVANPIVYASLYNVAATGVGLPSGAYDLLGALEGVSFLIVTAIIGAAAVSKVSTGSGLPAGPFGLLGLAEGLSFLSLVGALFVFPLRELGIVGNPETALLNVPELTESARVVIAPLLASAAATLSALVDQGLSGLELPAAPDLSAAGFPDTLPSLSLPPLPSSFPSLPEGLALPKELPALALPSLPDGFPSLPTLPDGLPSLPDGLPSLPSVAEPPAAEAAGQAGQA